MAKQVDPLSNRRTLPPLDVLWRTQRNKNSQTDQPKLNTIRSQAEPLKGPTLPIKRDSTMRNAVSRRFRPAFARACTIRRFRLLSARARAHSRPPCARGTINIASSFSFRAECVVGRDAFF